MRARSALYAELLDVSAPGKSSHAPCKRPPSCSSQDHFQELELVCDRPRPSCEDRILLSETSIQGIDLRVGNEGAQNLIHAENDMYVPISRLSLARNPYTRRVS